MHARKKVLLGIAMLIALVLMPPVGDRAVKTTSTRTPTKDAVNIELTPSPSGIVSPQVLAGNSSDFLVGESRILINSSRGYARERKGGTASPFNVTDTSGWEGVYINLTLGNMSLAEKEMPYQVNGSGYSRAELSITPSRNLAQEFVTPDLGDALLTEINITLYDYDPGEQIKAYLFNESGGIPDENITGAFIFDEGNGGGISKSYSRKIDQDWPSLSGNNNYFLVLEHHGGTNGAWVLYDDGSDDGMGTYYNQSNGGWTDVGDIGAPYTYNMEFSMVLGFDPVDNLTQGQIESISASADGKVSPLAYGGQGCGYAEFEKVGSSGGNITMSLSDYGGWEVQFDWSARCLLSSGEEKPIEPSPNSAMYTCQPDSMADWVLNITDVDITSQNGTITINCPEDWSNLYASLPADSHELWKTPAGVALYIYPGYRGHYDSITLGGQDAQRLGLMGDFRGSAFEKSHMDAYVVADYYGNISFYLFNETGDLVSQGLYENVKGSVHHTHDFTETGDYALVASYFNGTSFHARSIDLYYRHKVEIPTIPGHPEAIIKVNGEGAESYSYVNESTACDIEVLWGGGTLSRPGMTFSGNETLHPISNFAIAFTVVDETNTSFDVRVVIQEKGGDEGVVFNSTSGTDGETDAVFSRISRGNEFAVRLYFLNGTKIANFSRTDVSEPSISSWNFTISPDGYIDGTGADPAFKVHADCSQWYYSPDPVPPPDDDDNGKKGTPPNGDLGPEIVAGLLITAAVIALAIVLLIRLKKKEPEIPPEEASKSAALFFANLPKGDIKRIAKYFDTITSVHAFVLMHKDHGLHLSNKKYLMGHGLKEDLFTGFISALSSFEKEIGSQMDLPGFDKEAKPDSQFFTLGYRQFKVNIVYKDRLRLGVVSDDEIDEVLKEKCEKFLFDYGNKHMQEIKYFRGELNSFNDFPGLVEVELDGNLNEMSRIEAHTLEMSHDFPEDVIDFFRRLHDRGSTFYPASVPAELARELKIGEDLGKFITYEAYSYSIIEPTGTDKGVSKQ